MKIINVSGCPYEDNEGEVLNLEVTLEEGETLYEGSWISIEMKEGPALEREIKIINPTTAGDYAAVSEKAGQLGRSGKTLSEAKGPGQYTVVVMHVDYREVKITAEQKAKKAIEVKTAANTKTKPVAKKKTGTAAEEKTTAAADEKVAEKKSTEEKKEASAEGKIAEEIAKEEINAQEEAADEMEEQESRLCVTPYAELLCGEESIYDHVAEGYVVPDKVLLYLQMGSPYLMNPGIYVHPFQDRKRLAGPYLYADDYFCWDRDTWKYVLKYHLTLPQEFVEYVMSEAGTAYMESCVEENDSWKTIIKMSEESTGGEIFRYFSDDNNELNLDDF